MFNFLCKQGQHGQVISVLGQYGKPRVKLYNGPRGSGVMVSLQSKSSNRALNKALHKAGVPGSKSCRNLPLVKVEFLSHLSYENVPVGKPFTLVHQGRIGKCRVSFSSSWCPCCPSTMHVKFKDETHSF